MRRFTTAAALVAVVTLSACSGNGSSPASGQLPPRETPSIAAGVAAIPANASLSLEADRTASVKLDATARRAARKSYVDHVNLALGLLRRYVLTPSAKGRFAVTATTGPGKTTLGRAAGATTAAVAALDLAVTVAPTDLRAPTLSLRTYLSGVDHSLRTGATLGRSGAHAIDRLISALSVAARAHHLRLHATKAEPVAVVAVVPQWRVALQTARKNALRATIHRVAAEANSALGSVRRYVQHPNQKGKFASTVKPKSAAKAQHRAALALAYAVDQLAAAARDSQGVARLDRLRGALYSARQTLLSALALARAGRLTPGRASQAASVIGLLEGVGASAHVHVHPGHSPTFTA